MGNRIKVLLADDHAMVRMALASLLDTVEDFSVVGEAEDGEEAVKTAAKLQPDIVLMDLMMPLKDGVEATQEIKAALPDTKVILLTSATSSDQIAHGIRAGASGAILKSSDFSLLVETIKKVAAGGSVIAPDVQKLLDEEPPILDLSNRQREILQLIVKGLNDREIARLLGLSVYTVKEHVNALFNKIGAANRTEATMIAARKHLLKL